MTLTLKYASVNFTLFFHFHCIKYSSRTNCNCRGQIITWEVIYTGWGFSNNNIFLSSFQFIPDLFKKFHSIALMKRICCAWAGNPKIWRGAKTTSIHLQRENDRELGAYKHLDPRTPSDEKKEYLTKFSRSRIFFRLRSITLLGGAVVISGKRNYGHLIKASRRRRRRRRSLLQPHPFQPTPRTLQSPPPPSRWRSRP